MEIIYGTYLRENEFSKNKELYSDLTDMFSNNHLSGLLSPEQSVALGVPDEEKQFYNYNDSVFVVANAEIYNCDELIQIIRKNGHEKRISSNAEIIAKLYDTLNEDFMGRIRGFFSFILWDKKKNTVLAATDHFGVFPLSYYMIGENYFISSKQNLLFTQNSSKEVDFNSILRFLNFSCIPAPFSVFKNVYKLPPGHLLSINSSSFDVKQYWNLKYIEDLNHDHFFYEKRIRDLLREAVDVRLKFDNNKRFGAFLSGGTDSSTVLGMISDLTSSRVKAFSIGFDEEKYNEISFARIAKNHFDADHYEYFVSPEDVLNTIPKIIDSYDEPFGNSSAIPTYYCAKLAKENGVDILYSGDGGDELFAGNARYAKDKLFSMYQRIPYSIRKGMIEPIVSFCPKQIYLFEKAQKYIRRSNIPNPQRFFSYHFLMSTELKQFFTKDFLIHVTRKSLLDLPSRYYNEAKATSNLNKLLYIDVKMTLTDNDLPKVSVMSHVAGIKVRYPMLDYKLAEFSATIPSHLKLKGFKLRYIFKKAFENFLPKEIIQKRKQGFGLPVSYWLKTDDKLHDFARESILGTKSLARGYFKRAALEQLFVDHANDATSFYSEMIWLLIVLELWHLKYVD